MKINSASAEVTGYGSDAIEAFNQAVENGQSRLALYVLVDIIDALVERIEELSENKIPQPEEIKVEEKTVKTEEVVEQITKQEESIKPQVKTKSPTKEAITE